VIPVGFDSESKTLIYIIDKRPEEVTRLERKRLQKRGKRMTLRGTTKIGRRPNAVRWIKTTWGG